MLNSSARYSFIVQQSNKMRNHCGRRSITLTNKSHAANFMAHTISLPLLREIKEEHEEAVAAAAAVAKRPPPPPPERRAAVRMLETTFIGSTVTTVERRKSESPPPPLSIPRSASSSSSFRKRSLGDGRLLRIPVGGRNRSKSVPRNKVVRGDKESLCRRLRVVIDVVAATA